MLDTYGGGMSVLEKTLEEVISLNHYANWNITIAYKCVKNNAL